MFGVFRIARARKACVRALAPFTVRPQFLEPWPPQFWKDPFVLGFVLYVLHHVAMAATAGKLSAEQRGHVLLGTLKDLGGYTPDFMDRVNAFTQTRDPDFMLGGCNAETLVTYIFNLHPMPSDPDVALATELACATTLTGKVDRGEIGGNLMHLMFHNIAKKRFGLTS
jgi:hypothetical protein